MQRTIEQIMKAFETYATNYHGIEQFTTQLRLKNTAQNWRYPLMFAQLGNTTIRNGELVTIIDMFFLDKGDEDDYIKKLSKMQVLTEDFVTYFSKNEQSHGFYLNDEMTAEPIAMSFDDQVIGYRLPISVQTKSSENENLLPI